MLHARKCQERDGHHRAKAIQNKADVQKKLYSHQTKGGWRMSNKLGAGGSPPLIAVARLERGPQGQAIGTIATSPKEVDDIGRNAYGQFYNVNCSDQHALADKYGRDYGQYISKMPEAVVEHITGAGVKATCNEATHTAAGMGQWAPEDLKELSDNAYQHLADMVNTIEQGAP